MDLVPSGLEKLVAVEGSQLDCFQYPKSGMPREPPGVHAPPTHLRQHSPCTLVQLWVTPTPPPNGEAIRVWCPLGPLVYAGCSAAACAASTGGTQGSEALCVPWGPSPAGIRPRLWGARPSPRGSTTCDADQQWSKQVCHSPPPPPCPPPPPHTRGTYTQARWHLPPASATAGSEGGQRSRRPCDRTPGYGRPIGPRREGGADPGLATR